MFFSFSDSQIPICRTFSEELYFWSRFSPAASRMNCSPSSVFLDCEMFLWKFSLGPCPYHHPALGFEDVAILSFLCDRSCCCNAWPQAGHAAWPGILCFPYGSKQWLWAIKPSRSRVPWGPTAQEIACGALSGDECEYRAMDRRNPASQSLPSLPWVLNHSRCSEWRLTPPSHSILEELHYLHLRSLDLRT